MNKFLKKIALVISLSVLSIVGVYLIIFMFSSSDSVLDPAPFYVMEKAGYNSELPSVILGDSVCGQLWPMKKNSPNMLHLSCNQAITPAGTYLLLKKYLEHNPQTKHVYYAVKPQSLGNDMNLDYKYQYFLLPFYNGGNIELIDGETKQKIYSKFGKFFSENSYIKRVLSHNRFFLGQYLNHVQRKLDIKYIHRHRLSRTSAIYLPKILELCREHQAELHVLPLPLSAVSDDYGWESFAEDVKTNNLEYILGNFIANIHYYPAEWFMDGIHFKREILDVHSDDIRALVLDENK